MDHNTYIKTFEVMYSFGLLNKCDTERADFSEIWQ